MTDDGGSARHKAPNSIFVCGSGTRAYTQQQRVVRGASNYTIHLYSQRIGCRGWVVAIIKIKNSRKAHCLLNAAPVRDQVDGQMRCTQIDCVSIRILKLYFLFVFGCGHWRGGRGLCACASEQISFNTTLQHHTHPFASSAPTSRRNYASLVDWRNARPPGGLAGWLAGSFFLRTKITTPGAVLALRQPSRISRNDLLFRASRT